MCDFDSTAANYAIDRYKDKRHSRLPKSEYIATQEAKREMAVRLWKYGSKIMEQTQQTKERKYLKGCYLKKKESKFGTFTKGSIKMPDFNENKPNEKGYINFCIFETKEGKPYAVIDDWEENKENKPDDKIIEFEIAEEEIPF